MNSFRKSLVGSLTLVAGLLLLSSLSWGQIWSRIVAENKLSIQAVPADKVPRYGTFWLLQRTNSGALPVNSFPDLPVYYLGYGNSYLLDDSSMDWVAIYKESEAERALRRLEWESGLLSDDEYWTLEGGRSTMMMRSLMSSYTYANPVYLTNFVASLGGSQPTVASFSIAGGTNNVPYDILKSTNAATAVSQWDWLGIGYTSNRYTFSNQSPNQAFYILAKPAKTMIVSWGNDDYGQSDVPSGITNAVMVASGSDQSLALLNNGTVVAWGRNNSGQGSVPTNLVGVTMIAAGWDHNVALLTNGSVTAWGLNAPSMGYTMTNVPTDLTNATVISAHAMHSLALRSNGTVVAWGYNGSGETNVPAGLTNVTAIAAGGMHNLVVKNDGTVVAWGGNDAGQTNVPVGLSNVWDVAAGWRHSVALKRDGTVVAWGDNSYGQTNVPAGLSNVVAIAAGSDPEVDGSAYTLALKSDGTVVMWGRSEVNRPLGGLTGVFAIAGGYNHGLAIRSGPRTPVITLQPTNQYQIAGSTVSFTAKGVGLYGVTYQWKTNGVNRAGATNATLTLTNVQAAQASVYTVNVSNEVGSTLSTNATLYLVTPPVITSQTPLPTNQVCIYGNYLSFAVTATAPGQFNGYPLSYQWKFNGTNIPSANTSAYEFTADDNSSGIYSVTVTNAVGSASASWQLTVTNAVDVTKDLLLIYNTNSLDSSNVCAYYLAHRPMVSNANVLGIGCTNIETFLPAEYTNVFAAQVQGWLTNHPTKRPQYVILFPDIPSRVNPTNTPGVYYDFGRTASVSYRLNQEMGAWHPFVTSINMNGTNDCIAYINKLASFGTNLAISASAGGYGNTNYVLDNVRHGYGYGETNTYDLNYSNYGSSVWVATNGLTQSGVPSSAILYTNGLETVDFTNNPPIYHDLPHITNAVNVAGYISWGFHSSLGSTYATSGQVQVKWTGNSSWYVIETIESNNGKRFSDSGNFLQWFSAAAFGGTNYNATPVGAVTHVDEPGLTFVNDASLYFGLWSGGKNFAISAWKSRRTDKFQAVGDPFVIK